MSYDDHIAGIRDRIEKAEYERDHWRLSGRQEKYVEACSLIDSLGVELERVRQQKIDAAQRATFQSRDSSAR